MRFIKTQVYRYSSGYQYVALDNIACLYASVWQLSTGDVWRLCAFDRQETNHTLAVFASHAEAQKAMDELIALTHRCVAPIPMVLAPWPAVSEHYAPEPPAETAAQGEV